jgi:formylglycine-generating enzyme required for sulfatase activity
MEGIEHPIHGVIDLSTHSEIAYSKNALYENHLGMTFVRITPNRFYMGSPPNELGRLSIFESQLDVALDKYFFLQTTEVTQSQWKKVMGKNPAFFRDCGGNCPVENVSWSDVQNFIRLLNRSDSVNRYRLPTEAEWEYACRSGSTTAFSNSDLFDVGCEQKRPLDEIAWYNCNSNHTTHLVGTKKPNSFGLYDMHGNVNEWCQDEFSVDYSEKLDNRQLTSKITENRSIRSCSWNDMPVSCRSASRTNATPETKINTLGFRLVIDPKFYKVSKPKTVKTNKVITSEENIESIDTHQLNDNTEAKKVYTIQIESSKSLSYAQNRVNYYGKLGYDAHLIKIRIPEKGIWHRICLGNFVSKSDAVDFENQLAEKKIHGIIIKRTDIPKQNSNK